MNEGDHQIAQGGQNLRRVASAQPGAIFAKGHIAHVMERILNAPMAAHQFQKVLGGGQMRREHDEQVDERVERSPPYVAR